MVVKKLLSSLPAMVTIMLAIIAMLSCSVVVVHSSEVKPANGMHNYNLLLSDQVHVLGLRSEIAKFLMMTMEPCMQMQLELIWREAIRAYRHRRHRAAVCMHTAMSRRRHS